MPNEDISVLKSRLDALECDLKEVRTDVKDLLHAWEQGLGVAKFLKLMFYITAPTFAAFYWLKDHVKL